jgi:ribosomal protein S18 acetylase RimI-like enzyme
VTDSSDLDRAFAFERWVLASTSTRTVDLPWGTAFFNDEFPLKYMANLLVIDGPLGGATVNEVDAEVEPLFASLRHRLVVVRSEADADRLAPGLTERGYKTEGLVVMALRRDPDLVADVAAVEEIDEATARPLHIEITRREPWGVEPGIAEIMADHRGMLVRTIEARIFTQRVDGQLAGSCDLYLQGDVAQIEDVGTLEEFRGRGVARNVVLRAAHEAREAGARFVFLLADADDWPQQLYGRLGFDEIGRTRQFMRSPEGLGPEGPKSQEA